MRLGSGPENSAASLHVLGAFNLPLQSIVIILLSIAILRSQRALAVIGLIVGVFSLIAAGLSTAAQTAASGLNLGLGNGGMERLAGYPGNIWMLVVGVTIVVTGTRTLRRQRVASPTVAAPAF